jgi:hypothetical protein
VLLPALVLGLVVVVVPVVLLGLVVVVLGLTVGLELAAGAGVVQTAPATIRANATHPSCDRLTRMADLQDLHHSGR